MGDESEPSAPSDSDANSSSCAWRRSETPEESFSDADGANEDGEWPVEVIGEEVDAEGKIRYEARWPTWRRPDGTNVTWSNAYLSVDVIGTWKRRRRLEVADLVLRSCEIPIPSTIDLHLEETIFRSHAFQEKLNARIRERSNRYQNEHPPIKLARLLMEKLGTDDEGRDLRANRRTRPTAAISSSSINRRSQVSVGIASSSSSNGRDSYKTDTLAARSRGSSSSRSSKMRGSSLTSEASSNNNRSGLSKDRSPVPSSLIRRVLTKRALEDQWNFIAKRGGAASISIVNDVDDEETPPLDPNFQYIEAGYVCGPGVDKRCDDGLFVSCDCQVGCRRANTCGCQGPSDVRHNNEKRFAYSSSGLFKFIDPSIDVIECNKFCSCGIDCPNRVAQQPRSVDIEVFKTPDRGWGVRSSCNIVKGEVIGIYSGLLIRQQDAESHTDEERGYCFDLTDHHGGGDDSEDNPNNFYTINGQKHGNWSRFLNHSCAPNLRVYRVVYDTIPEMNMPYIGFVGLCNIPAFTELTVDYDPKEAVRVEEEATSGKRKRMKIPLGAKPCRCNSANCRGYLLV